MNFIQSQTSYFWTTYRPFKTDAFKYQQIKNTCTCRIKYFPTRNGHQRLKNICYAFHWMASTPAQPTAGRISAAKHPARVPEVRWGGKGGQSEGTSASKASTGPGWCHFCDSASNKSASLHRVQEAFGISILSVFKEADIGTPAKSSAAQPRAPPEGCQPEAAQATVPGGDAVLQRRVQMDTGSKSAVWR